MTIIGRTHRHTAPGDIDFPITGARCSYAITRGAGHREIVSVRIRVGIAGGRIGMGDYDPAIASVFGTTPLASNLVRRLAGGLTSPLFKFRQEPLSGFANRLEVLSCAVFHALRKAWRLTHDVQKKSASGAERHE